MSKPILSELEYNASDVASAILSAADLSVTNEDLGVTDRSGIFDIDAAWSASTKIAYSFNGFMFVNFAVTIGSTPSTAVDDIATINDSDFYPITEAVFPTISHQGDYALNIRIQTGGTVQVVWASNPGDATWYGIINGFYRY